LAAGFQPIRIIKPQVLRDSREDVAKNLLGLRIAAIEVSAGVDSGGNPTVAMEVRPADGTIGRAMPPSNAITTIARCDARLARRDGCYHVTVTPPPPGVANSRVVVLCRRRSWRVAVRPAASPTNAPNTTSLAQCLFTVTRDAPVNAAAAIAGTPTFHP
jgi:hypothetical protein